MNRRQKREALKMNERLSKMKSHSEKKAFIDGRNARGKWYFLLPTKSRIPRSIVKQNGETHPVKYYTSEQWANR